MIFGFPSYGSKHPRCRRLANDYTKRAPERIGAPHVSSRFDFPDFCSFKQDFHSENEADSSSSQPRIEKGHDFNFVWTCPHCGEVFNAATAIQRRYMRNNHLQRRHKHNRTDASDKIRVSVPLTPTSPLIPRDQRSWTCPQCFEGLPDLSSEHMVRKCALHHWAERRPGVKRKTWHTDLRERWEHWRKGAEIDPTIKQGILKVQQKAALRHQSKRNERNVDVTDHNTVFFTPHWDTLCHMKNTKMKSVLTSQATCVTCTTCRAFQFRSSWSIRLAKSKGKKYSCCPKTVIKRKQRCETWIKVVKNSPKTALTLAKIWGITVQEAGCAFAKTKAQADFDFESLVTTGIEPNPGPCTKANQISITTCNVRSGNGAWSFLDYGATLSNRQLPILCLQELRMSLGERNAFQRSAAKRGFKCFFQEGKTSRDRWGQPMQLGGVGILVDKRLQTSKCFQSFGETSQILGLWVEDWVVGTFYSPPGKNRHVDPQVELCQQFQEMAIQTGLEKHQWVFCGDANELPGDSIIEETMNNYGGSLIGTNQGTRWDSDREIDWFVVSCQQKIVQPPVALQQRFSDHIPLQIQLQCCDKDLLLRTLVTGPCWNPPAEIGLDQWKEVVQNVWDNNHFCDKVDSFISGSIQVNEEWEKLMKCLDQLMRLSFLQLHNITTDESVKQSIQKKLLNKQVKGGMPRFSARCAKRAHPMCQKGDMNIAKLRKRVARLHELVRLLCKPDKTEDVQKAIQALRSKLRLPGKQLRLSEIQKAIQVSKDELFTVEKQTREDLMRNWRQKFAGDLKFASKWIKTRNCQTGTMIQTINGPTASPQKAVDAIVEFWDGFWNSAQQNHPPIPEITNQLLQNTYVAPNTVCKPPEGVEISAVASQKKSSPGTDGWSGQEISALPPQFWDKFALIAERWLQAGELPEALLQARTIFLPKDSKTKDGCIEPMHCRPITILSVFWRVWVSAWLKKRTTTEWIKTVLHPEVLYGNQMDAANAAGNILEAYAKDKHVGTLDYTKCFDLLRPQACARMMTQAGFHPQMSSLCELLWTQHKRWCSWEGFHSPIPQSSLSLAIPQGDPFGPLVAALYLSAGQRCVESNIPHNHASSSIFMDDRTFTARSAADLHERVSQWHQWSTSVGLIESTEKTQVTAKGPANHSRLLEFFPDSCVKEEITFLGIITKSKHRPSLGKEKERLDKARLRIRLLLSLQLPSSRYNLYSRLFGVSSCAYGWVARLPSLTESRALWKSDHKLHRMANEWVRAVVYGGLSHLDIVSANSLIRVVYSLFQKGFHWNGQPGGPIRTFRTWMRARGWDEKEPWKWQHFGDPQCIFPINFNRHWDLAHAKHVMRNMWRFWALDQFLQTHRREVTDCSQITVQQFLKINFSEIRKLCDIDGAARAVATSATYSPATLKTQLAFQDPKLQCPYCTCLGTWDHVAWQCSQSPHVQTRPVIPDSGVARRFGWDRDTGVLSYLADIQRDIWAKRYPP